jgi:hypothetical protein
MTRAERRRRERDIFPCLGCGRRVKLAELKDGYCKKCFEKWREILKSGPRRIETAAKAVGEERKSGRK